jgi:hypothetical protein
VQHSETDPTSIVPHTPQNPIDSIARWQIQSLQRKQRSDSFFASLTDEQRSRIVSWFIEFPDLGEVFKRVIAPAPEGLGLKVSPTALRRLRSHWNALDTVRCTEEILDTITDMELESDLTQAPRIQNAISHLLHEKAFELARTVPGSPVMKELLTSIQKLSDLEHKRQKLLLDRERLHRHVNTPAAPQHHRVDLNIVNRNAAQTPEPRTPIQIQQS